MMVGKTMREMVQDLFDLRSSSIRVVLYKLEDVQTDIGLAEEGTYGGDLVHLRAQEALLREIIREMWKVNFQAGAR